MNKKENNYVECEHIVLSLNEKDHINKIFGRIDECFENTDKTFAMIEKNFFIIKSICVFLFSTSLILLFLFNNIFFNFYNQHRKNIIFIYFLTNIFIFVISVILMKKNQSKRQKEQNEEKIKKIFILAKIIEQGDKNNDKNNN